MHIIAFFKTAIYMHLTKVHHHYDINSNFLFPQASDHQVINMESSSSDLSSTEAPATSAIPAIPDVQVLIPQSYPGAFYYPPCKCDLVNQVFKELESE